MELEYVRCALCGADETDILFTGRDEWYGRPGDFPTRRCRRCGLIYLNPRPTPAAMGAYYPDSYAPYHQAISDEPSWWARLNRRLAMAHRLRLVRRLMPRPGRVLDVGCATGTFLAALRRQGWDAHGVEPNPRAAAYARDRFGLPVTTGRLADFPDRAAAFDLVIFWDVLEHVHAPRATLETAARLTRPGGGLLLALPDPGSLEARLFGPYWAGWDTPRHLYVYSRPVLRRLLAETGWEMGPMHYLAGRHWLFNLSLAHWLQNRWTSATGRRLLLAVSRSLPVRLLTLPLFWLLERRHKGSIMAVFARRCAP